MAVMAIGAVGMIHRTGTMVLPYIALSLVEARGFTDGEAGIAHWLVAGAAAMMLAGFDRMFTSSSPALDHVLPHRATSGSPSPLR